jgi:hypothetical protein
MAGSIEPDAEWESPVGDPSNLDIIAARPDGRVELVLVVGGPLDLSERTAGVFRRKFRNYCQYVNSTEFAQEFGPANRDHVTIRIRSHSEVPQHLLAAIAQVAEAEQVRAGIVIDDAGAARAHWDQGPPAGATSQEVGRPQETHPQPTRAVGWNLGVLSSGLTVFVIGWIVLALAVAVDRGCGRTLRDRAGPINLGLFALQLAYWAAALMLVFGMTLSLISAPRLGAYLLLPALLLACFVPALIEAPKPSLRRHLIPAPNTKQQASVRDQGPATRAGDRGHSASYALGALGYGFFSGFLAYAAFRCGARGLAYCFAVQTAIMTWIVITLVEDLREARVLDGSNLLNLAVSLLLLSCLVVQLVLIGRFLAWMRHGGASPEVDTNAE